VRAASRRALTAWRRHGAGAIHWCVASQVLTMCGRMGPPGNKLGALALFDVAVCEARSAASSPCAAAHPLYTRSSKSSVALFLKRQYDRTLRRGLTRVD
jgi:hypothetical protein